MTGILAEFQIQNLSTIPVQQKSSSTIDFFTVIRSFHPFTVTVQGDTYEIPADRLVFIPPGRIVAYNLTHIASGYRISFTSTFYERAMQDSYILNSKLFFDPNTVIQITKTHSSSDDFCRLIVERVRRFEKDVEMYALVAHHCIEELLIEGFEQLESPTQIEHMRKLSDLGVVNTFTVLVNKHYRKNTTVAYYANLMNMTYQKLSEICFNVLGKSAKDVISDIVIKEAIRYIRNTNLSISQISYELGFTDESKFRRFFKKHTGKTALTFRQR